MTQDSAFKSRAGRPRVAGSGVVTAPGKRPSRSEGRPPSLTMEAILDTSLKIVRAKGFDHLTMRRLADELGVTPMAPYYYLSKKRELLELVADEILSDVSLPSAETGDWEDRMREYARRYTHEVAAIPGLNRFLFEHQVPTSRRTHDEIFQLLVGAGFDAAQAELALAAFQTYMFGRANVLSQRGSARRRRISPQLARHPNADEYLEFALDIYFAGLKAQLRQ